MRAGQAGPALGVKTGLVAPVTVRVYFTRPRAGTDRTNRRSWSNQKPLHRGSRTCRPFAPIQSHLKEDRGFIDWLDAIMETNQPYGRGIGVGRGRGVGCDLGVGVAVGVGVGPTGAAQYLPPVLSNVLPSPPLQTIISLPLHTA